MKSPVKQVKRAAKAGVTSPLPSNSKGPEPKGGHSAPKATAKPDLQESEQLLRRSEQRLRSMLDSLLEGCQIIGADWRYLYVNDAVAAQGQTTKDALLGHTVMEMYAGIEKTELFSVLRHCMEKQRSQRMPTEFTFPDGSKGWFELSIQPVPEGILILSTDITERKRADLTLHADEERFRTLYENATLGMYRTTADGRILLANPAMVRMLGYSSFEELAHRNLEEEGYEAGHERGDFLQRIERDGEVKGVESAWKRKDGSVVFIRESAKAMRDANGETLYYEGTVEDITERKRAEEALHASQRLLAKTFASLTDAVFVIDAKTTQILDCNPAASKMFGYSWQEMVGRTTAFLHVSETALKEFREHLNAAVKEKGSLSALEYQMKRKDGVIFKTEHSVAPFEDDSGKQVGWVSLVHDITERKQAEALQEAVYRIAIAAEKTTSLDDLFAQIHEIISSVMPAENFYITLYDEKQNALRFPYFRDVVDEPYLGEIEPGKGLTAYVLRTGKSLLCTQAVHDELERKGAVKLLGVPSAIWLGVPLIKEGKTIGVMVVQHYTDPAAYGEREQHMLEYVSSQIAVAISRKQAEAEIKATEEEYRSLVQNVPDGVYRTTPDGRVLAANPAFVKMLGFESEEELKEHSAYDLYFDSKDRDTFIAQMKEGVVRNMEVVMKRKDGQPVYCLDNSRPFRDENGTILYMEGTLTDVTERKRAEEALRLDGQMMAGMADGVHLVRARDGVMVYANPQFEKMLGYEPGELIGKHVSAINAPADRSPEEIAKEIIDVLEATGAWHGEIQNMRKDGTTLWCQASVASFEHSEFDTVWISTHQDITERKRAEEEFRKSEAFNRSLVEASPIGILYLDRDGKITYENPTMRRVMGVPEGVESPVIGKLLFELPPVKEAIAGTGIRRVLNGETVTGEVIHYRSLMGVTTDLEVHSAPLMDSQGRLDGTLLMLLDITERKRAGALQEAVYRIAAATERASSLDDLFPQIHEIVSSVMPAENLFIALYDEKRNAVRFPYFSDASDEPYLGEVEPGKGLTAYVLRTGKSLLCTQAVHDELERRGAVRLLGAPSAIWLGVPLIVEGKTIGAVVVQHYTDPAAYGEREQHMLEYVSSQIAVAINRKLSEDALRDQERRYRGLFQDSPVAILEEDFSAVKQRLDLLHRQGVLDLREYISSHPDLVVELEGLIKIVDVNRAGLELYGAHSKDEMQQNLDVVFGRESRRHFEKELISMAEGQTHFETEGRSFSLGGKPIDISLTWSVLPGHEDSLSRVIVSIADITERTRAAALQDAAYRIAIAAERTRSLADLYPQIHEIVSSVMPAENFYITLYDEKQNRLQFPYFRDAVDEPYLGEIEPGKGLTAYVLRTGKSLLCTQAVHDELERQGAVKLLGVPSAIWLGVPLIMEGKTIGVMVVQHYTDPAAYGEREQHMLEYVSSQIAITISRKQAEEALRESEGKLRALFAAMTDVVIVYDADGRYVEIAPTNAASFRQPAGEMLGKTVRDLFPPEEARFFLDHIRETLKTGQQGDVEYSLRLGEQVRWFSAAVSALSSNLVVWVAHDVTERNDRERALRVAEEKYRGIFENAMEGILQTTPEGRVIAANPTAARQLGYESAEELIASINDIGRQIYVQPGRRQEFKELIEKDGAVVGFESEVYRKDGSTIWVSENSRGVRDAQGTLLWYEDLVQDITERKRAEQALRVAEEKYRGIFENAMIGILQSTPEGKFIAANPTGARQLGYESPEELISAINDIRHQIYVEPGRRQEFKKVMERDGAVIGFEFEVYRRDGRTIWVSENSRAVRDEEGNVLWYENLMQDITERRRAEQALRESEAVYHNLFENTEVGMFRARLDGSEILNANDKFLGIFGRTRAEVIGRPSVIHWADPQQREEMMRRLTADGRVVDFECRMVNKKGEVRDCITSLNLYAELGVLDGSITDITERKRAEARVQTQFEHLTAISEIDRMIASSLDLRFSLSTLLTHVSKQLGVDAADVLLLDRSTQMLEFAAGSGFRGLALQHTRLPLGQGYAGTAGQEQRLVHVSGLRTRDTDFLRSPDFKSEEFDTYVGVPLIAKGELSGVLEVFQRGPLEPDPEWFDFLNTLGGQAAIAIDSARLFENLQRSNFNLVLAYDATIEGWSRALDLRDRETEGHTVRVTDMCVNLARLFDLRDEELVHMRRGALLHDIGKMGVPDRILYEPGPLTDEDWVVMRKHPTLAFEMLSPIWYLHAALDIPYCHHEKWDGSGYPRGLKGEQIPLAARIFAVVDVWDALTSDRPYRKAWAHEKAAEYIRLQAGTHFDPQVVKVFLESEVLQRSEARSRAGGAGEAD